MNPVIQSLFQSFTQVFESENDQTALETFCKIISLHNKELGFFVRHHDALLLNNWLNLIQKDSSFAVHKINDQSFEIIIETNNQTCSALFKFIQNWQISFEHKSHDTESKNNLEDSLEGSLENSLEGSLEDSFNHAYVWIHAWMTEYLSDVVTHNVIINYALPKLNNNQIIHATGTQQIIKHPLSQWNKEDPTWWQNIPQSALALCFLSHNIGNQQLPIHINFELLTCQTQLNPKVKFEQLINNQNQLFNNTSHAIQNAFLKFELNCLNACTFFRPYKLLYSIIEFERSLQKLNALSNI